MDSVPQLQMFNNEISSLIVKPGCQLQVWEGLNYTGRWEVFMGQIDSLMTQVTDFNPRSKVVETRRISLFSVVHKLYTTVI
jgi:hypothetical protein